MANDMSLLYTPTKVAHLLTQIQNDTTIYGTLIVYRVINKYTKTKNQPIYLQE